MKREFIVEVYSNGAILVQDLQNPSNSVLLGEGSERAEALRDALNV